MMWPQRACVRLYRLRLVTFEPTKPRKAIPISVCDREGLAGVIPVFQGSEESRTGMQLFKID